MAFEQENGGGQLLCQFLADTLTGVLIPCGWELTEHLTAFTSANGEEMLPASQPSGLRRKVVKDWSQWDWNPQRRCLSIREKMFVHLYELKE